MSIKENDPNTIYKEKQWDDSFWVTKGQSALTMTLDPKFMGYTF